MAQEIITRSYRLLVIGGSAGSLEVLLNLLPLLKEELPLSIVIVLHRKNADSLLAGLLNGKTKWMVKEAEEKEEIFPRTIYLAPADYHLLIEKDKTFSLDASEKIHFSRPAIDVTFETAAEAYGSSVIALLLSGANADGAEGLKTISKAGGYTIVQDPEEASVSFMPEQAIKMVKADLITDTKGISEFLNGL